MGKKGRGMRRERRGENQLDTRAQDADVPALAALHTRGLLLRCPQKLGQ